MKHRMSFSEPGMSRRKMLCKCANGFGGLALACLIAEKQAALSSNATNPLAARPPHYEPRAKSVIFLFMDGGPSQIDTFDPKPRLDTSHQNTSDGRPFSPGSPGTRAFGADHRSR
ncbi:MAG: DUF1501 domain-containing protein [Acidobacteriota bacterium]